MNILERFPHIEGENVSLNYPRGRGEQLVTLLNILEIIPYIEGENRSHLLSTMSMGAAAGHPFDYYGKMGLI
jgi:hypothetical protein